jgi:uncharacterized membrane protein
VSEKHNFVVMAFESRAVADQALQRIEELSRAKEIAVKDAALVVKGPDGAITLDQTKELSVGQGTIAGGVAGFLLGLAIGGPIGTTLVGMVAGGGAGFFDTGIDNKRLKELGEELEPGQAAVGVLVERANWPLVRERVQPLGGRPLVLELTDEALAALEDAAASSQDASGGAGSDASASR